MYFNFIKFFKLNTKRFKIKLEKRIAVKGKGEKVETKRSRLKWITDFVVMSELTKVLVGTG